MAVSLGSTVLLERLKTGPCYRIHGEQAYVGNIRSSYIGRMIDWGGRKSGRNPEVYY
nr:MAG TPA: hypothetical protein [Caudoviricetes sp.]